MRVPNRVVLLTVSMVVLAGLLSAAAAFFYTRNVISDYDATVKREVEEKARAYGSASSVFLDALGPDALPVVQGLLTSEGETVASTESQALHNAFLSFEFWLPDASAPGGYRLVDSRELAAGGTAPRSASITRRLVVETDAFGEATAALDEEAQLVHLAVPLSIDEDTRGVAVATLSAEEEFAFFASRRNAAIRDGIILSVAIVGFVSIVGAGLSYYVSRDLTNRRRGEEAVRQSETRYRSLFEDSPIALVELDLSALRQHIDGLRHAGVNDLASHLEARPDELRDCLARLRSVDANRAALELYEAETKEELLSNWPQVSTEETFGLVQRAFAGAAVREGTLDAETTGRTLRGKIIDLSVHLSIAPGYERTWEKAILSLADISERQRAEQARARLTAILEATPDFVGSATPDGHVRYLNRAARSAIGVDEEFDVTELKMTDAHPDWTNDILFNEAIPAAIRDGFWSGEGAWLSRDGTETPTSMVLLSHKKSNGEVELLSTISRDITDRKTLEEQLAHAANYDPLTNLPNRRQFERALERALRDARLYGKNGALLFLDLDHFKDVNDSLGHRAGDELLSALARLLRENLRARDLLARVGGDEFTLLLPDTTLDRATGVAEKVRQMLHGHMFSINGQAIAMTGSVGIAFFPEHGSRPDELLARADLAMYQAKEDGRDRLCVFAPDRDWEAQTKSRLNWRNLIHDALENDRFTLHAQPILNVRTGRTSQYELLLRMIGPDDTTLLPADFLHIAERSGSIQPIERWVVRRAVQLIAQHRRDGHEPCVEVNLSGKAFDDAGLLDIIRRELSAAGVNPANLILEVTETTAVANIAKAQQFIRDLRELGCRFALDDFGIGTSSFYLLKHLSVDYLKIDGGFIRDLPRSKVDQHLVQAMVQIARGLGMETIAEYVADEETVELLRQFGVDYAQGFHVGRPRPASDVLAAAGRAGQRVA